MQASFRDFTGRSLPEANFINLLAKLFVFAGVLMAMTPLPPCAFEGVLPAAPTVGWVTQTMQGVARLVR
jgi:hypothetical protein